MRTYLSTLTLLCSLFSYVALGAAKASKACEDAAAELSTFYYNGFNSRSWNNLGSFDDLTIKTAVDTLKRAQFNRVLRQAGWKAQAARTFRWGRHNYHFEKAYELDENGRSSDPFLVLVSNHQHAQIRGRVIQKTFRKIARLMKEKTQELRQLNVWFNESSGEILLSMHIAGIDNPSLDEEKFLRIRIL